VLGALILAASWKRGARRTYGFAKGWDDMATMTAEDRIKNLTNAWYGFAVVAGGLGLLLNGIGVFSIASTVVSTMFSLLLTWWLGRCLLRRSSATRIFLLVVSGVMFFMNLLGSGKLVMSFFSEWSFSLLGYAALGLMAVYMNAKSFNTLTDKKVRAYFA
jgi:hypothetical protein